MRMLADSLAQLHGKASPRFSADGALRIAAVIRQNRESMEALRETLPRAEVHRLHGASLHRLEQVATVLDRRAAEGALSERMHR